MYDFIYVLCIFAILGFGAATPIPLPSAPTTSVSEVGLDHFESQNGGGCANIDWNNNGAAPFMDDCYDYGFRAMQMESNLPPNTYFNIMDALTLVSGGYGVYTQADAYAFGPMLSTALGFPDTDNCRKETARAMCFAGSPFKDTSADGTVRLPCQYCKNLFDHNKACGGVLSNFTENEMLEKINSMSNATLELVKKPMIYLYREGTVICESCTMEAQENNTWHNKYNVGHVRNALRLAITTLYQGCDATSCNACGNSFYIFAPNKTSISITTNDDDECEAGTSSITPSDYNTAVCDSAPVAATTTFAATTAAPTMPPTTTTFAATTAAPTMPPTTTSLAPITLPSAPTTSFSDVGVVHLA